MINNIQSWIIKLYLSYYDYVVRESIYPHINEKKLFNKNKSFHTDLNIKRVIKKQHTQKLHWTYHEKFVPIFLLFYHTPKNITPMYFPPTHRTKNVTKKLIHLNIKTKKSAKLFIIFIYWIRFYPKDRS